MRISERGRALVVEFAVASLALVIACWLLWPADLGLSTATFHPAWILVFVLSARYGLAAYLASLCLVLALATLIAVLLMDDISILHNRMALRVDLVPLLGATALACMAWRQRRRTSRLCASLQRLVSQRRRERAWNEAQEQSLVYLRKRCDRMDASVSLWKDISDSFERGRLERSATATLELSMIRVRATAGRIERMDGAEPAVVASAGACDGCRDAADDATVLSALAIGSSRRAGEVEAATADDCDVCIPIVDAQAGVCVAAIRLWGADPARMSATELRDLEEMAEWFSPVLARSGRGPQLVRASARMVPEAPQHSARVAP